MSVRIKTTFLGPWTRGDMLFAERNWPRGALYISATIGRPLSEVRAVLKRIGKGVREQGMTIGGAS